MRRFGGSVLADRIARDFREKDTAQLIGQKVKTPADLAALADVYRNPIFEVLRYVFVDDAGNVVHETAVSTRMPSAAEIFPAEHMRGDDGIRWLESEAKSKGATGLWLLHNHPSGDPTPSSADRAATSRLAQDLKSTLPVQGHVVLNHKRYGAITPDGRTSMHTLEGSETPDPLVDVRGDLAGKTLDHSSVARVGKRLLDEATSPNSVVLITINAKWAVTSVVTLPTSVLRNKRAGALSAMIGKRSAANFQIAVMPEAARAKNAGVLRRALNSGLLTDVITVDKDGVSQSAASRGQGGHRFDRVLDRRRRSISTRVYEGDSGRDLVGDSGPLESTESVTSTPEFQRWSRGAPVVPADRAMRHRFETGRPVVVEGFHGSPDARWAREHGIFQGSRERFGYETDGSDRAFWFASDRGMARSYADDTRAWDYQNAEPAVLHNYVRLDNPLVVEGGGQEWRQAQQRGRTSDVIQQAREAGHDGVVIRNVRDNYQDNTRARPAVTYVVFDPRQIKSATDNSGAFDPDNPSSLEAVDESRDVGEAEAEMYGLREAVERAVGKDRVTFLHGIDGLPDRLRAGVKRRLEQRGGRGRTAALYDPVEKQVYLFTDVVTTPERAVWNALHEIAGHHGLREFLGDNLDRALELALQNSTVRQVAEAIARERKIDIKTQRGRLLAAEEALAELAAAVRTGDFAQIESRYGAEVGEGIRERVTRAIENFVRRLKALIEDVFGTTFTDEDVRALLENAWQAAQAGNPTVAMQQADGSTVSEQVVFHGTPHTVDRFSLQRIGTGEGNQAFGWGLYFASRREVADHYREALAGVTLDGEPVAEWRLSGADSSMLAMFRNRLAAGLSIEAARRQTAEWAKNNRFISESRTPGQVDDFVSRLDEGKGAVYRVDIPEDSDLLDWDAPLSQQPEKVRAALAPLLGVTREDVRAAAEGRGEFAWLGATTLAAIERGDVRTGSELYEYLSDGGASAQEASEYLGSIGIPGLRYLDGGSRSDGDGSRNYVIWDEAAIGEPQDADSIAGLEQAGDYRGQHTAPTSDGGAPAHDLTGGGEVYPDDVYGPNGARYYGSGDARDNEAFAIVNRLRGRPDADVTIYRAVPNDGGAINRGDWVAITRDYAREHGEGALNGEYRIITKTVKARDIFTNGDSIQEWGYDPQDANELESATPDQTQTPAFRRWFGDSKVVDANGEPLVVYHGTATPDRDSFNTDRGAFFSDNPEVASDYASRTGPWRSRAPVGGVIPVYLSIQNPLEIDALGRRHDNLPVPWQQWRPKQFGRLPENAVSVEGALEYAREHGHDGVIVRNVIDTIDMDGRQKSTVYAVVSPHQIKSATANRGTFDPDSDSILESVEYTPEQQEFMDKAGVGVDSRGTLQKARDWMGGKMPDVQKDALVQSTLNRYYGLNRAVEAVGGIDLENDPYIAARQINIASTMEAILRFGAPKMEGGALRVNRSVPGLFDALTPVHNNLPGFFGWMVARRAQLLKSQGRENLMSDADIQAGLSLREGNEAAFDEAAGNYLRLKNAILDFAEQHGGTIDPVARAAWDHAEYIPFYRDAGEGGFAGPGTRRGLSHQSAGIRQLKGGEQALRDPLQNIIQNFTRLMDSALKNRAMLLAVDQLGAPYFKKAPHQATAATIPLDQVKRHLQDQGVPQATIDAMPESALKGVGRMLAIKPPEGDNIVRVMRNGKAEYYEVLDELVLRSVTALNEKPMPQWFKPAVWAKNLLTAGATSTPDFILRNLFRDTGEAAVTSRERFIPLVDTIKGAAENVRMDEFAQDLMMAGSYFHGGLFHQGDFEATSRATKRALRRHGLTDSQAEKIAKTLINPKRWWDVYRAGVEASEMGSRISLARNRMQAGGTFLEAAHEAKDFLDFTLRGDSTALQFLLNAVPFMNARLQGNYRLARMGTAKDRKRAVLMRMASMGLATAALYAWNMLAHRDEYEKLQDWDKDAYWHIGPGTDYHIRIPKPFELGLIAGTAVERGMAALAYHFTDGEAGDRAGRTMDAAWRGILETLALNPTPQILKPGMEVYFNENTFTGRPIESRSDEFLPPADRKTPFTSDTLAAVSRGMQATVGEELTLSPKQLQHLWRGYFGGFGMYFVDVADVATRALEDAPPKPERRPRDLPAIGAIYRGSSPDSNTRWVDEMYTLRDQAMTRSMQIKRAVENGETARAERLQREHGWLLGPAQPSKGARGGFMHGGVRELNRATDALAKLRKADNRIYEDREMTRAQKREALDKNARERDRIARELVRKIRARQRTARDR